MKKSELKSIIKEILATDESFQSGKKVKDYPHIQTDEIGTFWIVIEANYKYRSLDDILFECDLISYTAMVKEGLSVNAIIGIFKNKSEATKLANELILNSQRGLKEIGDTMEEFRKNKFELEEKKKILADKIKNIKNKTNENRIS